MDDHSILVIVESFNYATHNGLPVDCCGVASVEKKFDAWAKKHFPDVYDNAGDLEAYFLDEEGIGELAPFFTTITKREWQAVMKGLRASILSFYGDDPSSSDGDEAETAVKTIALIDAALGTSKKTKKKATKKATKKKATKKKATKRKRS